MIGLFVPLTLLLFGIVLLGSAFAFRSYGDESDRAQARWGRVFAVASLVSPLMLGVCVGAIASGAQPFPPAQVAPRLLEPWLAPFPLAIGLLTLALFAFLAAVYLTLETGDELLCEDFRLRALAAGVVVGALALASLALARDGAPLVGQALTGRAWAPAFHALTGACAVAPGGQAVTTDEQTMVRSEFISVPSMAATAAGLLQGLFRRRSVATLRYDGEAGQWQHVVSH